jgi:tripartite-type tricarboxylate transporter receptor subunit TctC
MSHQYLRGVASVLAAASLCIGGFASAQNYPTKPVRVIVPFGAGGGTDIQGRLLGQKFQQSMGQNFLVENRSGASGLIGAEVAARSPADGYTILFTTASLAVNMTLYAKRIKFDPLNDLVPVSWVSSVPLVLVVHPSVPAKNLNEFLALVKKSKPGSMIAGHNGGGTTSHLSIEMLQLFGKVKVTSVPYKGGGPAAVAQLSGETDFTFGTALAVQPFIKSGKMRPIAVTTAKRSSSFPELPTMKSVYPEFEADNWYAMFFPKGTPEAIVTKLNSEIVKALKSNDVNSFIRKEGGEPVGSTPKELADYFKREAAKYAKVIKAANVLAE